MEKNPANSTDNRISRMVEALRAEEMPSPPPQFSWEKPQTRRTPVRALVAIGSVAGLGLIVALSSVPRQSAAATLGRIAKSSINGIRHQIEYSLQPDGSWRITGENYADGLRYHSLPHGNESEQWVDGNQVYNLFRSQGYATVDTFHVKNPARSAWFYDNSLKHFFEVNHPKWVKDAGQMQWRGMSLERFDTYCEGKDALNQTLKFDTFILADIKSDHPYYMETRISGDQKGQFVGGRTIATEWQYPEHADLDLRLPEGTRLYDPEKMREQLKNEVTAVHSTDIVDGIKVTLRAVYASENGGIDVFTTGGTGRMGVETPGLRVDGKEVACGGSGQVDPERWLAGGKIAYEPLEYRGLKLIYQTGGFMTLKVPDEIDLEVPVWKADNSLLGRHFAGYAKFQHVAPIRYADLIVSGPRNEHVLWGPKEYAADKAFWEQARRQSTSSTDGATTPSNTGAVDTGRSTGR